MKIAFLIGWLTTSILLGVGHSTTFGHRVRAFLTSGQDTQDDAVLAHLNKLQVADWETRANGFHGLLTLAMGRDFGGHHAIMRIDSAFRRATRDKEPTIRIAAVEGLTRLPGDEIDAILRVMAESDPFSRPSEGDPATVVYPVRDAARLALARR